MKCAFVKKVVTEGARKPSSRRQVHMVLKIRRNQIPLLPLRGSHELAKLRSDLRQHLAPEKGAGATSKGKHCLYRIFRNPTVRMNVTHYPANCRCWTCPL